MSSDRPSSSDRLFSWLLRLFPGDFRGDFGEQMADDFRDQRQGGNGGRFAGSGLWARTVAGIVWQALVQHLDVLRHDAKYAARLLRRSPGFTTVAVLTLACGIGTTVAVFSLADGMLFRPLPFRDPDRLVLIHGFDRTAGQAYSRVLRVDGERLAAHHGGLAGMATQVDQENLTWTGPEGIESIRLTAWTPNVLDLLGVGAHIGRALQQGDASIEPRPAMLTYDAWRQRFGEDPGVVGRTFRYDQRAVQIVGVLPRRFIYPAQGRIGGGELLTLSSLPASEANDPRAGLFTPVARLRPHVSIAQAQAEADVLIRQGALQFPETARDRAVRIAPLQFALFELGRPVLWLLVMAAAGVLLVACANLATLLISRSAVRAREIGIRAAIGAGRGRIIRQLFVEALVLGGLGGAVALLLGWFAFRWLSLYAPTHYRLLPDALDARTLAFTAMVSIAASVLFAVLPALALSRGDVSVSIRDRPHLRRTGGLMKAGGPLVALEVALGLILFAGTALTVNSLIRMRTVDLGFDAARLLPLSVGLGNRYPTPPARYDLFDQLLQSVRRLPDAEAAGGIDVLPWSGARPMRGLRKSGTPFVGVWTITPGYFRAAAVPILQGQDFTEDDVRGNAAVAIVSEATARLLWPAGPALGQLLEADGDRRRRVIGVVKDVRAGYGGTAEAAVYWPVTREGFRAMTVVARTSGDAGTFGAAMRTAALQLDRKVLVNRPAPVSLMLDRTLASARFETLLFSMFGVLALIVAAIGVYGLTAFWVGSRMQEMGVRMALGASHRALKSLVLRQAALPLFAGIVGGLFGAFVLTRRLESLLYGITPHDPATFVAVVLILAGAGLLAAYVPARRAASVDPIVTLRAE
jgi:putative ABC transport system permease protein